MKKKESSISKKIQRFTLITAALALLFTSAVGIIGMLNIRREAICDGELLGTTAADESQEALLQQMRKNVLNVMEDKSRYIEAELQKYSSYVNHFASFAQQLYDSPQNYTTRDVEPPLLENKNKWSMQRYLLDETVLLSQVWDEMCLLGNLEDVFAPVMKQYEDIFATVYVGTESGFLLSYDTAAHTSYGEETVHTGEFYYGYKKSEWYQMARKLEQVSFTDTYQDAYGRGLTVTCVAPVYDSNGTFRGALALDILIDDLNRTMMEVDLSEHAYPFLVNKKGEVLASPDVHKDTQTFDNILEDRNHLAYEAATDILSGTSGIVRTTKGEYYAYSPIAISDWTVAVWIPESDVIQPITEIRKEISNSTAQTSHSINSYIITIIIIFMCAFIAIIILVIIVAGRMAEKISSPIIALGQDVEIISSGNLEHRSQVHTNDEIGSLAASFNEMTVSLKNHIEQLTTVTAEKERIGAELDVATKIQASMLPCIFPAFPERKEFEIFATMNPAKEVGGDFYDFFMVDEENLAVVMADVSGKGVPAALFMVIGKTLIKDHTTHGKDLGTVFSEVNDLLCESNSEDLFITAFVGVLNLKSGEFRYVNAGHEMPFICKKEDVFKLYKVPAGFVLAGMEGIRYKSGALQMEPGDKLFLYTDGVTDILNNKNEFFGKGRLEEKLAGFSSETPEEILTKMKACLDEFSTGAVQFDDITMLCLEYKQEMQIGQRRVTVSLKELPGLTEYLERELEGLGVPGAVIVKMNIALDEIFSNIVKYSGATYTEISCGAEDNMAYIIFEDDGIEYNPLEKEEPDISLSANERECGGLGIYMVKKSMDEVQYEYLKEKNRLTLKKCF